MDKILKEDVLYKRNMTIIFKNETELNWRIVRNIADFKNLTDPKINKRLSAKNQLIIMVH